MTNHLSVSPLAFFTAFQDVTSELAQPLHQAWPRCKDLTNLMRSEIFPRVADHLGLNCCASDYYTLDGIFYVDIDNKHFAANTAYAKFIAVALEHENDAWTTAEEINKLQLFNTPLKVLITYPESAAHARRLLGKYAEIIGDADVFQDITSLRRQLVIFGFWTGSPSWQAFAYAGGSFRAIDVEASV